MNDVIKKLRAVSRFELDDASAEVLHDLFKDKLVSFKDSVEIYMHRVQFLFFRHILNDPYLDFEKMFGKQLSAELVFLQKRYEEYINYIEKLVDIFHKHEIPYAILKGFSIINSLYTSNGVIYRDFGDVDILVNKSDIDMISHSLTDMGYIQGYLDSKYNIHMANRKDIIYWRLNSHQEQQFIKHSSYSNISPLICCKVDINTTIFEGGKIAVPISTEQLLKNTRPLKINENLQVSSLSYELELIQLCYHFYKDMNYKAQKDFFVNYTLIKFCDIREYIRKYRSTIDWERFISYINTYEIGQAIYTTLFLVSLFYGDLEIDNILNKIYADKSKFCMQEWDNMLI